VTEELSGKEKLVLQEECELVTVMEVVKGQLEVTTTHMHFFDHTPSRESGDTQDFKWQLEELREIHFRRYNLRRSALEFFFVDQSNCFINFQKEVEKSSLLAFCVETQTFHPSDPGGSQEHTSLITNSFFIDFAFIIQFKHKGYLNSWLYLICFSVTTGHFCTRV